MSTGQLSCRNAHLLRRLLGENFHDRLAMMEQQEHGGYVDVNIRICIITVIWKELLTIKVHNSQCGVLVNW